MPLPFFEKTSQISCENPLTSFESDGDADSSVRRLLGAIKTKVQNWVMIQLQRDVDSGGSG